MKKTVHYGVWGALYTGFQDDSDEDLKEIPQLGRSHKVKN